MDPVQTEGGRWSCRVATFSCQKAMGQLDATCRLSRESRTSDPTSKLQPAVFQAKYLRYLYARYARPIEVEAISDAHWVRSIMASRKTIGYIRR